MLKSEQFAREDFKKFYLGNDVVDLLDLEVLEESLHPRFDERVFTTLERDRFLDDRNRHLQRWLHWSIKEATYKAIRRHRNDIIFSPKQIVIQEFEGLCAEVFAFGKCFTALIDQGDGYVNATVFSGVDRRDLSSVVATRSGQKDISTEVRSLACQEFSTAFGLDLNSCEIPLHEKIPSLYVGGRPVNYPLSLSHHGRFVAVSCGLPSGPWLSVVE